jgi:hypothetical protein
MYKSLTYDPAKDLVGITNVATGPQVIAVNAAAPFKDLNGLIAYARANPKRVNFGSAGIGTQTHLAAENFAHAAGIDLTHIPYKGESAALTDLLGGQIQLVTPNITAAVGYVQQGRLRALAVTSPGATRSRPRCHRHPRPPGFENAGWFIAPTAAQVIERIRRTARRSSCRGIHRQARAAGHDPVEIHRRTSPRRSASRAPAGPSDQGTWARCELTCRSRKSRASRIRALKILPPDVRGGFRAPRAPRTDATAQGVLAR